MCVVDVIFDITAEFRPSLTMTLLAHLLTGERLNKNRWNDGLTNDGREVLMD
jgi:hypothetical protein